MAGSVVVPDFGDHIDADVLILDQVDEVFHIFAADIFAGKINFRRFSVGFFIEEGAGKRGDYRLRAKVRAADTDDDKRVAGALDFSAAALIRAYSSLS